MVKGFKSAGHSINRVEITNADRPAFDSYVGPEITDPAVIARLKSNMQALQQHEAVKFCFFRDPTPMG